MWANIWQNIDIYLTWLGLGGFALFFLTRVVSGMESNDPMP